MSSLQIFLASYDIGVYIFQFKCRSQYYFLVCNENPFSFAYLAAHKLHLCGYAQLSFSVLSLVATAFFFILFINQNVYISSAEEEDRD